MFAGDADSNAFSVPGLVAWLTSLSDMLSKRMRSGRSGTLQVNPMLSLQKMLATSSHHCTDVLAVQAGRRPKKASCMQKQGLKVSLAVAAEACTEFCTGIRLV